MNPLQETHIKYYNSGQVSQHPSLVDGNHHMSTFPLFTKYAWIGQGISSVKKFPIIDTASLELIGELSIPVVRFPMETVQRGTPSQTNTWTLLMHSATM